MPVTRDRTLLEWIYRGSWIVGVAIDAIADDMTKMGITITSEMPPGAIKKLETAAVKWGVWPAINDTIRWGRLYGGSLAAIMVDGQDPRNPLDISRIGLGAFRGLMVYDRWMVEPDLNHMVRGVGDDFPPYRVVIGLLHQALGLLLRVCAFITRAFYAMKALSCPTGKG